MTSYSASHKMEITPISQLRPGRLNYSLYVRISRLWEFRGTNEQNDIKHLDLVLIDQKGTPIYAEIPPEAIPILKPHLQERKIVYISKISIERAKPDFRVVDNAYMVKLNKRTEIIQEKDEVPSFHKYTFSLTPFDMLEQHLHKTDRFIDIIARISAVSNAAKVRASSGDLTMRRVIRLEDLRGKAIELSLAGKRALEFDGDQVVHVGQHHHVIAIFVGTLFKLYRGQYKFLSGTSACRWYINENDIPEIKAFQKSLPSDPVPIQKTYLQSDDDESETFEKRTLEQLKHVDPFLDIGQKYLCTATITAITENQTWCYKACKICNSRMIPKGNYYQCTKDGCPSMQFEWKYKIPFIVNDNTYSLEFVFFEKKAVELIGKSAATLRKQYEPKEIPPEILAWIGYKFTFVVRILSKKSVHSDNPSFEVLMIRERIQKEPIIPPQISSANISTTNLSAIMDYKDLPLLVPISSTQPENQNFSTQSENATETQDMDIETFSILEESQSSNKRSFADQTYTDQQTKSDHDDVVQDKKTKRLR